MIKMNIKKKISTNEGSLHQKTIKGSFWSFTTRISTLALDIIQLVIVARLLNPKDYGLLGIALLTQTIFLVFTETGFQESIIQKKKKNIEEYLNTAWTTLIIRGLLIYTIIFFAAPYIAIFFNEPRAAIIIQVIGLSLVMSSLNNIAVTLLRKELEFNKTFILNLGRVLPSFIMTVALAFILRNVWALVGGVIMGSIGSLYISYLVHPYRPKIEFDRQKASEMLGFGKWIFGITILVFIGSQGDDLMVGRIVGVAALGLYQMAYRIAQAPLKEFIYNINTVLFSTFSKVQDYTSILKSGYLKVTTFSLAIAFPVTIGLAIIGREFTIVFLGEKWMAVIPILSILAMAALVKSFISTSTPIFKSVGKPRYEFEKQLVRASTIIILIVPLTQKFGIIGTSYTVLISCLLALIVWYKRITQVIDVKLKELWRIIAPPLIGSIAMAGSLLGVKKIIDLVSIEPLILKFLGFLLLCLIGTGVYFLILLIFQKYTKNYKNLGIILRMFKERKKKKNNILEKTAN